MVVLESKDFAAEKLVVREVQALDEEGEEDHHFGVVRAIRKAVRVVHLEEVGPEILSEHLEKVDDRAMVELKVLLEHSMSAVRELKNHQAHEVVLLLEQHLLEVFVEIEENRLEMMAEVANVLEEVAVLETVATHSTEHSAIHKDCRLRITAELAYLPEAELLDARMEVVYKMEILKIQDITKILIFVYCNFFI